MIHGIQNNEKTSDERLASRAIKVTPVFDSPQELTRTFVRSLVVMACPIPRLYSTIPADYPAQEPL